MSIVIATALVLADASDGLSLDHPIIGYHNVVTASNIAATAENASYPASNLANPATHLKWTGTTTGEQYLTITTGYVDDIDYVAVAGHNWATAEIPVSVEGYIDGAWTNIVDEVMLADDGPYLGRFDPQSLSQIRIKLAAGSVIPTAAAVYVGKLVVVERKIYEGHIPLTDGIKTSAVNGKSESGNHLGRIVLGEWRESVIPLSLLTPAWFRTYMRPFLTDGRNLPFFFGWRPETYPREIGYVVLTEDPEPVAVGPSNLIAFDMRVSGVA